MSEAQPGMPVSRADLHLHSRASTDTGNWVLRQAVLPESYTEPLEGPPGRLGVASALEVLRLVESEASTSSTSRHHGLPAIVSDRGAAAEQVEDEVTGLVAPGTVAIAQAIERLAGDAVLRRRIGASARVSARRCPSWETVFGQLEDSYLDVLEEPVQGHQIMRFST